jgi:hypothetical protein
MRRAHHRPGDEIKLPPEPEHHCTSSSRSFNAVAAALLLLA